MDALQISHELLVSFLEHASVHPLSSHTNHPVPTNVGIDNHMTYFASDKCWDLTEISLGGCRDIQQWAEQEV
jgi:hypothetical protein